MAAQRPTLEEITLLVRTPGDVHGYRSFTEAERSQAEKYAADLGFDVEQLP